MAEKLLYKRILFKLSGEALMGDQGFGVDMATVNRVAGEIAEVRAAGVEIGLVIGGGNIFRGVAGAAAGMERANADHIGMLATVMNALTMKGALQHQGVEATVFSALAMPQVCEPFRRDKALEAMANGQVVLFAAGTGNPYFTTDTGAALRAAETNCDAFLKGTSVDGVYSADPKKDASAERFDSLTYRDMLSRDLKVMDLASITLARDARIPVIVFSIREPGNLLQVLRGKGTYSIISDQREG